MGQIKAWKPTFRYSGKAGEESNIAGFRTRVVCCHDWSRVKEGTLQMRYKGRQGSARGGMLDKVSSSDASPIKTQQQARIAQNNPGL
jgi:hypothetical protein